MDTTTEAPRGVEPTSKSFSVSRLDKVDVLFVIDNSNSMAGEQAALNAQFPRLIHALTQGQRFPDDPDPFFPVTDLHVGVVSTDMGLAGVEYGNCHADGGDGGRLQHTPHTAPGRSCDDEYAPFLSYDAQAQTDVDKFADDFACVAALGTGGCGFEQQLEAGLRALWPVTFRGPDGVVTSNPIVFLGTTRESTSGLGDVPTEEGGNLGFLRDDSLLMIVVVTDEDDCSVRTTEHLWPNASLPDNSPYKSEVDINLRCFNHPELNYDVINRYQKAFQLLRSGREDRVIFTAIVGVPPDLVDAAALGAVNFADAVQRSAFYNTILSDDRMQQVPDPASQPGSGNGNLKPSCQRAVAGETLPSTAYPPRRIVSLAEGFGENGMVQSICQDDFSPAIDSFLNLMAKPLRNMCMPQQLARSQAGTVDCKLYWQLPAAAGNSTAPARSCSELGDLLAADPSDSADKRCEIRQLAVDDGVVSAGEGWYYDDFSPGLENICSGGYAQRIMFSTGAKPAPGVSVKLECHEAN